MNKPDENNNFLYTTPYKELYQKLCQLKEDKGNIIHVLGAPGTGKSTNIYRALDELELSVYETCLPLTGENISSKIVLKTLAMTLKKDLKVKTKEEAYERLSEYDSILIADKFHDYHLLNPEYNGFSQWTRNKWYITIRFYLKCILEYIINYNKFKSLNIILQTSWRVKIGKKEYDLFTELGVLSKIAKYVLGWMFDYVEISYSPEEVVGIVLKHLPKANEEDIPGLIQKYGPKPRFICKALDDGSPQTFAE